MYDQLYRESFFFYSASHLTKREPRKTVSFTLEVQSTKARWLVFRIMHWFRIPNPTNGTKVLLTWTSWVYLNRATRKSPEILPTPTMRETHQKRVSSTPRWTGIRCMSRRKNTLKLFITCVSSKGDSSHLSICGGDFGCVCVCEFSEGAFWWSVCYI